MKLLTLKKKSNYDDWYITLEDNEEKEKEKITCLYVALKDKITAYNLDKETHDLHPKKTEYNLKNIKNYAKRSKYKLEYDLGEIGEEITISFKKTKPYQPYIDIIITDNSEIQNNKLNRWLRTEKKQLSNNFYEKLLAKKDNFYSLLVRREDIINAVLEPDVCILASLNKNIFIRITGKRSISEDTILDLKKIFNE